MSYWASGWEQSHTRPKGEEGKYRGQCKLGRHVLLAGTPAVWLKDPIGLSCQECALEAGFSLAVEEERKRVEVPVPAARKRPRRVIPPPEEWKHGEAATYSNLKCRCPKCRKANSARSASYRARKRQPQAVAS